MFGTRNMPLLDAQKFASSLISCAQFLVLDVFFFDYFGSRCCSNGNESWRRLGFTSHACLCLTDRLCYGGLAYADLDIT